MTICGRRLIRRARTGKPLTRGASSFEALHGGNPLAEPHFAIKVTSAAPPMCDHPQMI